MDVVDVVIYEMFDFFSENPPKKHPMMWRDQQG